MDFKLTITRIDAPLADAAATILSEHGENFDAARGDFDVEHDEHQIVIVAKDVAKGDMQMLVRDIETMYGEITYQASSSTDGGAHYYTTDLDEED